MTPDVVLLADLATVEPGTILATRERGVWHEGLRSDRTGPDGVPLVLHRSKRRGRAVEESAEEFTLGVPAVRVLGYPGQLDPAEVCRRARAALDSPWTYRENCQAYTRHAHGVSARVPDAEFLAAGVILGAWLGLRY